MPEIQINTVTGGRDKDKLKKCFFVPTNIGGLYEFFAKINNGNQFLAAGITSGSSFTFTLDGYTWTIPDPSQRQNPFSIDATSASGSWKNNDTRGSIEAQSSGESGTFQGQAGSSLDSEEASSASA